MGRENLGFENNRDAPVMGREKLRFENNRDAPIRDVLLINSTKYLSK